LNEESEKKNCISAAIKNGKESVAVNGQRSADDMRKSKKPRRKPVLKSYKDKTQKSREQVQELDGESTHTTET